jgi:23S rRNA (cytidine1920-2'-O)/16S rRNA (cytidine1409-2'-O)-methyltransferase
LRRLDQEIVKRQLARSRGQAVELIEAGNVLLNGFVATKPTTQVNETCSISIKAPDQKYVSRAALKLLSALNVFQIDITGKNCVDAGASTGGFTQVLLERGADKVYAVDVGYGQLAWQLQQDSRVEVLDRTNIKNLSKKLHRSSCKRTSRRTNSFPAAVTSPQFPAKQSQPPMFYQYGSRAVLSCFAQKWGSF